MVFLCCASKNDRDSNPTPNRPVDLPTVTEDVNKADRRISMPSYRSRSQKMRHNPSALSTAEEKHAVFDQSASTSHSGSQNSDTDNKKSSSSNHSRKELASSQQQGSSELSYAPPAGPPPGHQNKNKSAQGSKTEIPPDNPPPPYHNWEEAVPDTAFLPPPPVSGYLYSNTANASEEDADRAHVFCDNTPLWKPHTPSVAVYDCVKKHDIRPVIPHEYNGGLDVVGNGKWKGRTVNRNKDCLLLTGLPLYFPTEDSPLVTEQIKTIYFEVKLLELYTDVHDEASGFSIGFAAQPYPTWRAPGWERGSLGVFSDDGCKFVNDSWGGQEFTAAFDVGETVGIGMRFHMPVDDDDEEDDSKKGSKNGGVQSSALRSSTLPVEVFFTRDGKLSGGWDLHEETDEEAGGVGGLEGDYDLYGAIGLFGGVGFEVCFDPAGWKWDPESFRDG